MQEEKISLYPNPSRNYFVVKFSSDDPETYSMKLYDLNGRLILEKRSITPGKEIDISHLREGIYLVNLTTTGEDSPSTVRQLKLKVGN
ncbi:MAG: T9SS type A sorting domain-containing protein [Cyclobacteriaceae bacterium]